MCIFESFVRLACGVHVCTLVGCLKIRTHQVVWGLNLISKTGSGLSAQGSLLLLTHHHFLHGELTVTHCISAHSLTSYLKVFQHVCKLVGLHHNVNVSSDKILHSLRVQSVFMKHNDCIFLKTYVYFLNKLFWCRPFIQEFGS